MSEYEGNSALRALESFPHKASRKMTQFTQDPQAVAQKEASHTSEASV